MSVVAASLVSSLLQDAVYDLLRADAVFLGQVSSRFYTDVPQGTPFPLAWLTFGDPAEEPDDTFGKAGSVVRLEVHVFSEYEGDDQCLDILSRAASVVHDATVTVAGWSVPLLQRTSTALVIEEFNGTPIRHGIVSVVAMARAA